MYVCRSHSGTTVAYLVSSELCLTFFFPSSHSPLHLPLLIFSSSLLSAIVPELHPPPLIHSELQSLLHSFIVSLHLHHHQSLVTTHPHSHHDTITPASPLSRPDKHHCRRHSPPQHLRPPAIHKDPQPRQHNTQRRVHHRLQNTSI